jgi:hypothetical protein
MATQYSNLPGTDPTDYIRSLLDLLGDRDPLAVLAATPAELRRVLEPVAEAELRRPEAPGKWSLIEVAAHLADSEVVFSWRLRHALADESPTLTGYDQNAWAGRFAYAEADRAECLTRFEVLRGANLRLLRGATPADWERVCVHSERGEESVRHLTKLYAAHDLVHLRQIERIRKGARRNKSSRMVVTVPQRWDAMDGYPSRIGP